MASKGETYHHGDLRAALLAAAETVLARTGIEGFSLRQVAREVGVSHSAPAHHFGDSTGLLQALSTDGFRRFLAAMKARQAEAPEDPREMIVASGFGYLDFATGSPALFRLMFGSDRVRTPTDELLAAGEAAFDHLAQDVARLRRPTHMKDPTVLADVMAVWSMAHGFAELLISGRMGPVQHMSPRARRVFFRELVLRTVP